MKNQTKPQHTPTPWKVTANGCIATNDGQTCIAIAPTYGVEEFKTDATFIVRAVNSHEELLKAAKVALERLGKLPGSAEIGTREPGELSACDMLQRAIAKAEGK